MFLTGACIHAAPHGVLPYGLDREHGVQAPLPLVLVHDFEGYDLIAHGRDEIRPVLLGGMFRADVEYAPLVGSVRGVFQVKALGFDDEDLMKLVIGLRFVRLQGEDEVRIDLAAPPSLYVVVLPRPVSVPEKQAFLLIQIRRDLVFQSVQIVLVDHVEQVALVLAVENDIVPFDRADILGAGLRPGLPW